MQPESLINNAGSHNTRSINHTRTINNVLLSDSDALRFWSKVDRRGDHECWLWRSQAQPNGYGMFRFGPRTMSPQYAHRVAYVLSVGPLVPGLEIGHRCHTRNCVNPAHLDAMTHTENVRHSARDGRLHAPRPRRTKLTDAQCDEIVSRVRAGESQSGLALAFDVSTAFVSLLVKGKRRQYRKTEAA